MERGEDGRKEQAWAGGARCLRVIENKGNTLGTALGNGGENWEPRETSQKGDWDWGRTILAPAGGHRGGSWVADRKGGDWAKERGEPALSWTPSEYMELHKTHSFRPQINSTRWISRYFYLHVRNGKLRYQWSIFPTYLSISISCFLCTRRTGPFAVLQPAKYPPPQTVYS